MEEKVRTKTNLLPADIDADYLALVRQIESGKMGVDAYLAETLRFFGSILETERLDEFADKAFAAQEQLELLRRHLDDKRYTVLMYRVEEGEVHPPHHHFNVISTQIVMRGRLRIREYERVRREEDGTLILKLASDGILEEGDSFQATEWQRNVHWFQAIDGPALVFNTNIRGFEGKTFDLDEGRFGRRYLDPTHIQPNGEIRAEEFGEPEATNRFSGRSLDEFVR